MTNQAYPEIYLVEDDRDIREVLAALFESVGYTVTCFAETNSFLAEARKRTPQCVLLDIQLPGTSGLDALSRIDTHRFRAPIIVLSAHCRTQVVVEAVKRGAFDFIEKPFAPDTIVERVQNSVETWRHDKAQFHATRRRSGGFPGEELLTPREHDVLARIIEGDSSKEVALQLGISFRTVQVHRARIMDKLKARNTADLVNIVFNAKSRSRYKTDGGELADGGQHYFADGGPRW
jgi:FixJ family two-component response regulator